MQNNPKAFIDEVNQELKDEKIQSLWKKFGKYIILLGFLIVASTGGYSLHKWYVENENLKLANKYKIALESRDPVKKKNLLELTKEGNTGVSLLSSFNIHDMKNNKGYLEAFHNTANNNSINDYSAYVDLIYVFAALNNYFSKSENDIKNVDKVDKNSNKNASKNTSVNASKSGSTIDTKSDKVLDELLNRTKIHKDDKTWGDLAKIAMVEIYLSRNDKKEAVNNLKLISENTNSSGVLKHYAKSILAELNAEK